MTISDSTTFCFTSVDSYTMRAKLVFGLIAVFFFQFGFATATFAEPVAVMLAPVSDGIWQVTFETRKPTQSLKFVRTPDDSRVSRWRFLDRKFHLVHHDGDDWIEKRNGKSFSRVTVWVPATYLPLPNEYSPFSPFRDGGLLAYTGRYHACSGDCSGDSRGAEGPWPIILELPSGVHAIVNGEVYNFSASWMDRSDGTKIYVGPAEPFATRDFISVVDKTLPGHLAEQLSSLLPALMEFYSARLVPPTRRPMLFASYDPGYDGGYGRQGGTLPDQVFIHFYGPGWADNQIDELRDDTFSSAESIRFFFAHEAAHLFQVRDRIRPLDKFAWIHEGGAEALALRALTEMRSVSPAYAEQRKAAAFDECVSALTKRPLNEAAQAGAFQDHYACGLLMNLSADSAVRRASLGTRNLFDVWRTFLAAVQRQSDWNQENFLQALGNEGAYSTATFLHTLANDRLANPRTFLSQGLAESGLSGNW